MEYTDKEKEALKIQKKALELGNRIGTGFLLTLNESELYQLDQDIKKQKSGQNTGKLTVFQFLRFFNISIYEVASFYDFYVAGYKTPASCAYKCLVLPDDVCPHGNPAFMKLIEGAIIEDKVLYVDST